MNIIPAIDIMDKKVVRLEQGQFETQKVYSESPLMIAKKWRDEGARLLHVVDLDGARLGKPVNLDAVNEITKNIDVEIELGGGLRSEKDIDSALAAGVRFVVIGTSAVENEDFLKSLVSRYKRNLIFAVDAKNGKVATRGWKELGELEVADYVKRLEACDAERIIYTDISRDGMMSGPNTEKLRSFLGLTSLEVTVSGGISGIEDVKALKELEKDGLKAVIVGKALYEGTLDLKEALSVV